MVIICISEYTFEIERLWSLFNREKRSNSALNIKGMKTKDAKVFRNL
jgi:hypothetical protein